MARPANPPQVMEDGVACFDLSQLIGWGDTGDLLSSVEGVEAEWSEERLVDFMFACTAIPAQRRAWRLGKRRPALQRQLHALLDGEVGGAGVVEIMLAYLEPMASELSLAWMPELLPERVDDLKSRYSDRCQSSTFHLWQVAQLQRGRDGEEQLAQVYAQLSEEERHRREQLDALQCRHAQWREQWTDGSPDARDSRLGGLPYLAEGDEWPTTESMRAGAGQNNFVLQLRLSQLPDDLGYAYALPGRPLSDQLVQVFGGRSAVYDSKSVARLVDCSRPARVDVTAPAGTKVYPAQFIAGWSGGVRSFPYHEDWLSALVRVPVTAPLKTFAHLFSFSWGEGTGKYAPTEDDRAGGWSGQRDRQEPHCPLCDRVMEQLLQVNSGTIGFEMYGCLAPIVVSQCPEHKEQLRCDCPMEID